MLTQEIEIASGRIRGARRDEAGVLAFKGIPYAAPPVGRLRWRAPEPPVSWAGLRDATAFGAGSFAAPMPAGEIFRPAESEDCLTLNVWTAARDAGERRPVMVWIHGGGFQFGSSAMAGNDGTHFAADGAVLVSINYRLGVFGFLAHPELDREGEPSGNFALQDMIAALRWVKENIAQFGGDPDCVTIFGESAGAHAIGLLMASPLAHGLFHRAIGQSGAWWDSEHGPLASAEEARARGLALMRKLGAADIEDMRAMPASRVNVAGAWNFLTDPGVTAFSPSVDGYVLPDVPGRIFAQGKQTPVPLLAGWNRDEHAYFTSRGLPTTGRRFRAAAARQFGAARMADFDTVYPSRDRREARRSADMLIGDLVISQQIWSWGGAHRARGAPAFLYEFRYASAFSPRPIHTADIPFVFGNLTENAFRAKDAAPEAGDRAFSRLMRLYWINFARAGDPNGEGLPHWPLYEGAGSNVMHLSRNSAAAPETVAARFAFIESFREEGVLPADWRAVEARMSSSVARLVAGLVRLAARCRRLPGR